MLNRTRRCSFAVLAVLIPVLWGSTVGSAGAQTESARPVIEVSQIPPAGGGPHRMETISGVVKNADPARHQLVIFSRTDRWYVQPFVSTPFTKIRPDGTWTTHIHLGEEYALLLVEPGYEPPATVPVLPGDQGEVIAILRVTAAPASSRVDYEPPWPRVIEFSGFSWRVKRTSSLAGPGPNYFSDAPEAVWVDERGRLHLRIRRDPQESGRWLCAEVVSKRSFGHGTYRFHVDSNVDALDPRAVLGMFTWSDAPEFHHREIDIEIARWGKPEAPNAQFVVQPWTSPENILRFAIPRALPSTVHAFSWLPGRVRFWSTSQSATIQEWVLTRGIPPAGGENARINLWLLGGLPPQDEREIEVVIRQFDFQPGKDEAT